MTFAMLTGQVPFDGDDYMDMLERRQDARQLPDVDAGPQLLRHNVAYFDELERRCRAALAAGAPASPPPGADVEALAGFPFEDAVPPGHTVTQPEFYRPGHQANLRAALGHFGR